LPFDFYDAEKTRRRRGGVCVCAPVVQPRRDDEDILIRLGGIVPPEGAAMKCFPLLVLLFLTILPTKQSISQAPTSTQATQTDSKKAASDTTTPTKKPKKAKNTAKADKSGNNANKLPTVPGEEAAYELTHPKSVPQGSSK
jgi:hypothetical protein